MKYELFFSKSSVVIKVIMPNTNIIYQHMGFDNFLEDQYFEDEDRISCTSVMKRD